MKVTEKRNVFKKIRVEKAIFLVFLFILFFLTICCAEEAEVPLLLEVEGRVKEVDGSLILEGKSGKNYLLFGENLKGFSEKEVKVLGKPMLPSEKERLEKNIRFVIEVMEIEQIQEEKGGE